MAALLARQLLEGSHRLHVVLVLTVTASSTVVRIEQERIRDVGGKNDDVSQG
jgi:hypothetical protein